MGLSDDGFEVVPGVASSVEIDALIRAIGQANDESAVRSRGGVYAIRNLLDTVPEVREWAESRACRALVELVLGPRAMAIRGILFDKTPGAN